MNERHRQAAFQRGVLISQRADETALSVARFIDEAIENGRETDKAIAAYLNERGIPTRWGYRLWYSQQVKNMRARLTRLRGP